MSESPSYVFCYETGTRFRLSKWIEGDEIPTATYNITYNEHSQVCDCPSYKQPCKHIAMITEWLEQPHPERTYFNGESGTWQPHPFSGQLVPEEVVAHLLEIKR